jgi:hypothetical protein
MANKYSVNGTVIGNVVYAGIQEKTAKSGNVGTTYTLMFVSPEGVTFSSEKTIWKSQIDKGLAPFISNWINDFHKVKDIVDSNKGIKEGKENVFVKATLYPSKDGRMFSSLGAVLQEDKNRRTMRLKDAMPQIVKHTNTDSGAVLHFDREEFVYKMDGRRLKADKKKDVNFADYLTRFRVAMIAREVNDEQVTFVDYDSEYPVVLETVSAFDNSRIEIGQGYEFEVTFEKGQRVAVQNNDEDFGWDNDASATTKYTETPNQVRVFAVKGRVADYTMNCNDDFLGEDNSFGF